MEFTVEFYEAQSGRCPVREFLDELKEDNPDDFAIIVAGLAKLRDRQYHKPPLSKPLEGDLFELRHVGKLNTRVLYFFARGRRIIAVHGIRNKAREISRRDLRVALERKDNWLSRVVR
jgi:phage-related protein